MNYCRALRRSRINYRGGSFICCIPPMRKMALLEESPVSIAVGLHIDVKTANLLPCVALRGFIILLEQSSPGFLLLIGPNLDSANLNGRRLIFLQLVFYGIKFLSTFTFYGKTSQNRCVIMEMQNKFKSLRVH